MNKIIIPLTKEEEDKLITNELDSINEFGFISEELNNKLKERYKELYNIETELYLGIYSFDGQILDLELDEEIIKSVFGSNYKYKELQRESNIMEISYDNFRKLKDEEVRDRSKLRVIGRIGDHLDSNIVLGFIPIKDIDKKEKLNKVKSRVMEVKGFGRI